MHMAIIVPKGFADLPLQVSLLIHLLYLYLAMPTSLCRGEKRKQLAFSCNRTRVDASDVRHASNQQE